MVNWKTKDSAPNDNTLTDKIKSKLKIKKIGNISIPQQ
jgi:hypothetical protein